MTHATLRSRFKAACEKLGLDRGDVEYRTVSREDGSPHIEIHGDDLHFVVSERGEEFERRTTRDPDELLYWLVTCETFGLAIRYELAHRRPNQDFRRIMFAKELELLSMLDANWAARRKAELGRILENHPFNDTLVK